MLVLSSFILFAFRVAFVFSIGENLFLASNDEVVDPLSASIFGSGGAGSGNLFETSIDEGSSAPFDIALGGPKVAEPYIDLEGMYAIFPFILRRERSKSKPRIPARVGKRSALRLPGYPGSD